MPMPAFTAQHTIYKTTKRYLTSGYMARSSAHHNEAVLPAMVNQDVINCSNCVGGDCAMLHCFENWSHGGGGGGGGPYDPGGGGGGGMTCSTDVGCRFDCIDQVFNPCYNDCVSSADGNVGTASFRACKRRCDGANRDCAQGCRVCTRV